MMFDNIKKHHCRCLLATMVLMLSTTSCFTGVESTPAIGNRDLKRHVTVTPEQQYLADVTPQPFALWQPGKQFLVTDPRIAMIFNPGEVRVSFHAGDKITFQGAAEVTSPVGRAVDLSFSTPVYPEIIYRINAPLEEVNARDDIEIPFTVELDVADRVRDRLLDHTFFIVTPRWYDAGDQLVTRRKFIPVRVTAVNPGNFDFPVRVSFSPVGADSTSTYSVLMSVGNGPRATRNFDTLFSLSDPRERYSHIPDETWQAIIEGRIFSGMTRDEARLSLGSPREVDRGHDYSSVYERWTYDGGTYLIFRDNILESFRR